MPEINGISLPFIPAGGLRELNNKPNLNMPEDNGSFGQLFEAELDKLKFSAHAQSRMTSREIDLSDSDVARLEKAVETAGSKGANDSLIMLGEKAFIVNVPNKTVITVVNKESMESNIVTDIDSAVFA